MSIVPKESIEAVIPEGKGCVISVKNPRIYKSVLSITTPEGKTFLDKIGSLTIAPCTQHKSKINIIVHSVPTEIQPADICRYLSSKGVKDPKLVSVGRYTSGYLEGVRTGEQSYSCEKIDKPLPGVLYVNGFRLNFQIRGSKSELFCTKCWDKGHFRRECPNEIRCKLCRSDQHVIKDCPKRLLEQQERENNRQMLVEALEKERNQSSHPTSRIVFNEFPPLKSPSEPQNTPNVHEHTPNGPQDIEIDNDKTCMTVDEWKESEDDDRITGNEHDNENDGDVSSESQGESGPENYYEGSDGDDEDEEEESIDSNNSKLEEGEIQESQNDHKPNDAKTKPTHPTLDWPEKENTPPPTKRKSSGDHNKKKQKNKKKSKQSQSPP